MADDVETQLERAAAQKPLMYLKPAYEPFLALWRRPWAVALGVLTPVFMMPELRWLVGTFAGLEGEAGAFAALFGCFLVTVGLPLIGGYLESRAFSCAVFSDHLAVTRNWLLNEKIRIPYRHIAEVRVRVNRLQRRMHVADFEFMPVLNSTIELPTASAILTVRDVARPGRRLEKLRKILGDFHAMQAGAA